jgi:hypothetical protein
MTKTSVVLFAAATLFLSGGAALAKHGKVGLWNVTSTTDMTMPAVVEKMKKLGVQPKGPQRNSYQMCMSQEEVDSGAPPHMDSTATGCDNRVIKQSAAALTVEMRCTGAMKGTGRMEIAYRGAEHYSGSYSFAGTVEGNATSLKSTFQGDWVKTDCGKVKPYRLRTQ